MRTRLKRSSRSEVSTSEEAKVNKIIPRFAIYVVGAFLIAFGVVLNTRCDMGASTVNCIPFVFSEATGITLGQGCMILYAIDIVIQIIVFRKFTIRMALQIPFSFVMGLLVDMYDYLISSGVFSKPRSWYGYHHAGIRNPAHRSRSKHDYEHEFRAESSRWLYAGAL